MTFRQLIKGSFFHFSDLKGAKDTPFWKAIIYLLVLSVLLAIPSVFQAIDVLKEIKADSLKIVERIPDFTISDGEIKTADNDADGFIYQTNSIIFTFDPDGSRSEKDVKNDLVGNYFSIGLLKKEAILALPDYGGISTSVLGDNVLKFSYNQQPFKGLTSQKLKSAIQNVNLPGWLPILMLVAGIYPTLISLAVTIVFISFAAWIFARMRLKSVGFLDCFKTIIFCASIPTVLSMIILFFQPQFDYSLLITIISMFIFFTASRGFPNVKLPGA
ncbi:DUF1189 domain-containing protein [Enterococcus sp. AZ103]|uniref:DUF1189 domain-containing protein n=1 Tax=Enterococcus sp. AZ103 TaxID=2774628 RepID=UPI003F299F65